MERGGNPHPDEVIPPTIEEGLEFFEDLKNMGDRPPLEALGHVVTYFTDWGKVEILDDRAKLDKCYRDIVNRYRGDPPPEAA